MTDNRIAIVGRAGRFPAARSVREFWQMLDQSRVATTRLTDEQLLAAGVSRRQLADPRYVRAANILPDMEAFDAPFFGFSPKEASILDPQHRHFLETVWEALEDAGHMPDRFDGRIGVYAGSGMQAYLPYNLLSNPDLVEEIGLFLLRHTGNDKDFLPTRASYLLNLTGPSMAIQTACSTSLVAVHVAANALLNMECDMALAGGVTIELPHYQGYRYAEGEILSPDGYCRAFDDDSQGTVFGSGSAVVVLRRMEDALADGDDIKAVILATAVNNDGASKASYLAPSVEGQAEAAGEALALSGVKPETIGYIEAHGTGTPIGDPIELSALAQVYRGRPGSVGIGSVKTNIGHLDTAAGGASLIKVIEALRHKRLPASLNFRTPNSRFDFAASPFRVVAQGEDWAVAPGQPRRAAVNSLGVGGTNAHVIVEEAPAPGPQAADQGWRLFPFSARDAAAVQRTKEKWTAFLTEGDTPDLTDMAFTLREGRRQFPARMAVAACTVDGLVRALSGQTPNLLRQADAGGGKPEIVFLFPGGGAQYPGAGASLLEEQPAFAAAVEACFSVLPANAPPDLHQTMFACTLADEAARRKMARSAYAIPALFILEYAYTQLLASWGVKPDAIVAHSVGEYAGAVAAGVLTLADAMRIVTLRGEVMDAAPPGAMTTVPADEAATRAIIGDSLDIAAVNAPGVSVVSGTVEAIRALEARLSGTEREAKRIQIDVAAHSRVLDNQLDRFRAGFDGVRFGSPAVPMVSSLRGAWGIDGDFQSADYWVRHLRHTVRFTDALKAALDTPGRVVVEVGPGQTLSPLVRIAEGVNPPRAILPMAPKPTESDPETGVALAAVGGLWAAGAEIDWARLPGGTAGRRVSLPTYAFDRTRHWIAPGRGIADPEDASPQPLARRADPDDWFETEIWVDRPLGAVPPPSGTWLILSADDTLSASVIHQLAAQAGLSIVVARRGTAFAQTADGFVLRPDQPDDYAALFDRLGPTRPARIVSLWPLVPDADVFGEAFALSQALQIAAAEGEVRVVFAADRTGAAAVLGPVRVAPREIEGLTALVVEVDGTVAAASLVAEAAGTWPDRVRLSAGRRQLAERTPMVRPESYGLPHRLRAGGVYLVTGGTGGIGRSLALWLATTVQAKVALVSRSGLPDASLADEVTRLGGALGIFAADVTDKAALASVVADIAGRWGQITGVMHAAGLIADAPLAAKTLKDARDVLAPKATGAQVLSDLFPDGTLDVFCVFSSTSVEIAPPGQIDYVSANALAEAVAASRSDGLVVSWGTWSGLGMAERAYGAGEPERPGKPDGPLPGAEKRQGDGTVEFARNYSPATDWVLADHVVGAAAVLPASAYMEIAVAAVLRAGTGTTVDLRGLSFLEPMAFTASERRMVRTTLRPAAEGLDVTLVSGSGDHQIEHASWSVLPGLDDRTLPPGLATDPVGLPIARRSGLPPQDRFITFGPRWQVTGEVRSDGTLTLGRFALPPALLSDLADTRPMHPGLLDMAMTVGLHGLTEGERAGVVYAPVSVDRVRWFAPLPAQISARARLVHRESGRQVVFDAVLSDPDDVVLAIIEGLTLRAIPEGQLLVEGNHAKRPQRGLTAELLATGLTAADAPLVFDRVFRATNAKVVATTVAPDLVRLALARTGQVRRADTRTAATQGRALTEGEARLAAIWSDLLGVPAIGADDDFFALGGHSLNAVRLIARIRKEFGLVLPFGAVFETPTLSALSRRIQAVSGDGAGQDQSTTVGAVSETAASEPRVIDLTDGQREILSGIAIDPSMSQAHNLCFAIRLSGDVRPDVMQAALDAVVMRHDALQAGFRPDALHMNTDPTARVFLQRLDLSDLSGPAQEAEIAATVRRVAEPIFDLERPPLMRAALLVLGPDRADLVVAVHHLVCDGFSIGIVAQDLAELYAAGAETRVPRLPPGQSIADLVAAEQARAQTSEAARDREYWRAKYHESIPAMDLPSDHPRSGQRLIQSERLDMRLGGTTAERLNRMAADLGLSLPVFVMAAFAVFLSRLVGSEDVVIGLPTAGQLAYGLERAVGHGVNFLPLRIRVGADERFADYLQRFRQTLTEAMNHQAFTYGNLMQDLKIVRDPARMALVPVVVNIDNLAELGTLDFGHASGELRVLPTGNEHFELFLNLLQQSDGLEIAWNYNSGLFESATVARYIDQFERLIDGLARQTDMRLRDVGKVLSETYAPASGTHVDPGADGPQTIPEVFRAVAQRFPDRTAVEIGGVAMDYRALDAASDGIAAQLAGHGVRRGDLVGITAHRRPELIAAVLGVLKAGAGYVPFDTALPAERLAFMAKDTGIRVLIGDCQPVAEAGVTILPFETLARTGTAAPADPGLTGEDVAYVMYTSGTTGVPKGVVLPHRSVIRLLIDTDWVRLGPDTVTLHSSAFAFDTSIIDIFGALLHGGRVVLPPDGPLSVEVLADSCASGGVNTLWLTSGLFHAMADIRPEIFAAVEQVIVGGDIVSPVHVEKVMTVCPGITVINGYGPTESNVTNAHRITRADLASGQSIPIGQAIPGTQIYILDPARNPVPTGMMGELAIAGRGLALGYWNRPELTAEKFITAPWDPRLRLYLSGDLASNPGDGVIRFFGRIDSQVKIRGFRVELAEVEAVLEQHPQVAQATVVATVPPGQTDKVLVAYVVGRNTPPTRRALAEFVRSKLPAYARPSHVLTLDSLPLNQNGKVDRRALPPLTSEMMGADRRPPETETERRIARHWTEALGTGSVGVEDDFFDMGGHSLLAIKLFAGLRREFGLDLPISTLFQYPTLRDLAQAVDRSMSAQEGIGLEHSSAGDRGLERREAFSADAPWDTTTVISPGPGNGARALFIVGGVGGNVNNLVELGREIGRHRPVIGLQTRGVLGHNVHDTIEAMAADDIAYIRRHQAKGPYLIAGYSGGALTAFEIVRQLAAAGEETSRLVILDTFAPGFARDFRPAQRLGLSGRLRDEVQIFRDRGFSYLLERTVNFLRPRVMRGPILSAMRRLRPDAYRHNSLVNEWLAAARRYEGAVHKVPVTLIRSEPFRYKQRLLLQDFPYLGWDTITDTETIDVVDVPGDHNSMVHGEGARLIALALASRLGA